MSTTALMTRPDRRAIPPALFNACFVLFVINAVYFPTAYLSGWWIYDPAGLGIPADFVNVWAAGKLVLDGHPALAYDWNVQKQVEVALLGQDFIGYFAWHYPPPCVLMGSLLGLLAY
jgi:arabinofuranan 3-O-arabinosyltransferase